MTTLTLAFTRAVAATLGPATASSAPASTTTPTSRRGAWPCDAAGAEHVLAPFDPATGSLDPDAVIDLIDERTRWVAVTGASNLLGTIPDLAPIIAAAHAVGARVFVDAVHLAPHRRDRRRRARLRRARHLPVQVVRPARRRAVRRPGAARRAPVAKVRPAADRGRDRWETGTPSFEAIAAVDAAARFLLDEGLDALGRAEAAVFAPLLDGLLAIAGVRVWGPPTMDGRTPTVAFTVDGHHPDEVAAGSRPQRIATWAGHSYAVEVVDQLGLAGPGGVVRAGVVAYIDPTTSPASSTWSSR